MSNFISNVISIKDGSSKYNPIEHHYNYNTKTTTRAIHNELGVWMSCFEWCTKVNKLIKHSLFYMAEYKSTLQAIDKISMRIYPTQ